MMLLINLKSGMKREIMVTFEPLGMKVRADAGKTIFDIARENGVAIRSECGGKGICGKCKIIVGDLKAVSALTSGEENHLTEEDICEGYRLACLTRVQKDLVVTIPLESRIVARKMQLFGIEKRVKVKANVKKIYLILREPNLGDTTPDLERLVEKLKQYKKSYGSLRIDYQVIKVLPSTIRSGNWKVTATVWNEEEIIAIEEGNTVSMLYGLAIDVGTSKIVVHLVSLSDGRVVGVGAIENPQMMYGEDIISRITYAMKSERHLRTLQLMLINGINEALIQACEEAGISPENIYEAIFVGNTAMHHFFFGISPKYVALSPYVPVLSKPICVKARDLNVKINPNAMVYSLPIIGGFVGPDAVADMLAVEMHESNKLSLLLDIGTNTEVFLGNRNFIMCCSCASGPAFEGVHIKHGVKAVDGAIERVEIESPSKIKLKTINDKPPIGICGTGMIDAVAEMFKHGIINDHGRFTKRKSSRLKEIDGEKCFVLAHKNESGTGKEIIISQRDINEVLLAKAAIFTGCSVLIEKAGASNEALDKVYIAGAFGTHINPENAKVLGLVPDVQTDKIVFVGNTAIVGAKMALVSKAEREKATEILKKTAYIELAAEPSFISEFSKALFIPHKELERFPSVKNRFGGKA
jgi:uncharacterized 2Fe-2S/4Fe-4S cluster protein (DUF4445 family)